jgi:hypothetical protein
MWCPDPACGVEIPDAEWEVINLRDRTPWDAEAVDDFHWAAVCPSCRSYVGATHLDSDAPTVEPHAGWCCPVCGSEAKPYVENRGPLRAGLRCVSGCGALIALGRPGVGS